jgi:hypothetical protein
VSGVGKDIIRCVGQSGRQVGVWSRKRESMGCVLGEMDISKVCGIGKVVRTVEGFCAEWMSGGGVE